MTGDELIAALQALSIEHRCLDVLMLDIGTVVEVEVVKESDGEPDEREVIALC